MTIDTESVHRELAELLERHGLPEYFGMQAEDMASQTLIDWEHGKEHREMLTPMTKEEILEMDREDMEMDAALQEEHQRAVTEILEGFDFENVALLMQVLQWGLKKTEGTILVVQSSSTPGPNTLEKIARELLGNLMLEVLEHFPESMSLELGPFTAIFYCEAYTLTFNVVTAVAEIEDISIP